jgi:hypothetical protein
MALKKDITLLKVMSKNILSLRKKKFPGHGGQGKCIAAFGANRVKWSRWEHGTATPGDADQRKLAAFFSITLSELRGEALPVVQDEKLLKHLQDENIRLNVELKAANARILELTAENGRLKGRLEGIVEKGTGEIRRVTLR